MRRVPLLVAAGVAITLALPAAGPSRQSTALVEDSFPSGATVVVELIGLPPVTVQLSSEGLPDAVVERGPLVLQRAGQRRQRGVQGGSLVADTEVVSMELRGKATIIGVPDSTFYLQAGRKYTPGRPPSKGKLTNVKTTVSGDVWRLNSDFTLYGNATADVPQQRGGFLRFDYEWGPMEVSAEPFAWDLPPNRPVDRKLGRVDHYKCYTVKAREKFTRRSVSLSDQFEDEKATAIKPLTLCAPVRKNRSPLQRPSAHLKCYSITSTSDRPKQPEVDVTVTNQFGTAQLVVLGPRTLCLPTLKKKVKKAAPRPQPPPGSLVALTDHFKCYGVRPKTGFQQRTVSLDDQFETERARVLQPVLLCPPVEKNLVKLRDSTTHLVCYTIQDSSRKEKPGGRLVVVRNQFGVETLTVLKPQMLCVPSTKKPPCSVYAERSRAPLRQGNQIVGYINEARHTPFLGNAAGSCP